jgi:hypothetical protein
MCVKIISKFLIKSMKFSRADSRVRM